jgi:glycine/D-amino acid oxidase-like deaminating enzyme
MLSFWEKQWLLNYDMIIIGGGIVGLSTALSIKERAPQTRVLVLERGILPTGASTKNAGFACTGSLTEIIDDLGAMPESEVLQLVELRLKGLKKLRKRLGDATIDYAENGSWELINNSSEQMAAIERIDQVNEKLAPVLGDKAFESHLYNSMKGDFGFDEKHVHYLVKNNFEGELNSGMMMRALIDLCLSRGVEIKTGCQAERIEETKDGVRVVVKHTYIDEEINFSAAKLGVCTNAFAGQLYPELDIKPGRGQVLITEPIAGLRFKGIYHFDKGYYYFRRLNGRVLFGGGRNIDFEGEQTTSFEYNERIRADLMDKLQNIILPGVKYEIADWWTGIMAFGATKFPILKRNSDHVCLAVRMGGMGVAMGSEIGDKLAEMMLG